MDLETGGIQRCEAAPAPATPKKLPCFVPLRDAEEAMPVGGKARQLCRIRESTPDAFLITTEGFALLAEDPEAFARQLAARLRALGAESVILRSSFCGRGLAGEDLCGDLRELRECGRAGRGPDSRDRPEDDRGLSERPGLLPDGARRPGKLLDRRAADALSPRSPAWPSAGMSTRGTEQILIEYVLGHLSVLMDGKVTPMRSFFRKAAYYEQPGAPREWMPPSFLVPLAFPSAGRADRPRRPAGSRVPRAA